MTVATLTKFVVALTWLLASAAYAAEAPDVFRIDSVVMSLDLRAIEEELNVIPQRPIGWAFARDHLIELCSRLR